ncbi:MAG: glycosyl hydrolase family 32 [Candidatus Bipolaricaulia bacterium]
MYVPTDHYLWDFWLLRNDELYHLFYLRAPRDVEPEQRHFVARVGHATSRDLVNWRDEGVVLEPGPTGAWDEAAIWTGSVIAHGDQFHMLYTAIQLDGANVIQRIGLASSNDLHRWHKHPDNPVLEADPRWYELEDESSHHERAWRDPYVVYRPTEDLFYAAITARQNSGPQDGRGCIALARSTDLREWEVRPPLYAPRAFGQMEVPQWVAVNGHHLLLFSLYARFHASPRRARVSDRPQALASGTFAAAAEAPFGPFALLDDRPLAGSLDAERYGAKLVRDPEGRWALLHWIGVDHHGTFVGGLSDPQPVDVNDDGHIEVAAAV